MKLHVLAFKRTGTIPFPESLMVTAAGAHDLSVFKQAWGDTIAQRRVFGDKIYVDAGYFNMD
ncbi:MAG: hypothetical protein LBU42_05445 [Prevotellaceae bacterium]|nr:hypothetical protein [Prevotellaceae bacterium]